MEWIQLIVSMAGVIGLIFFMFFLLKKVNARTSFVGGNKLRIIDRASLGRESALTVVSVCGKLMLMGISAGRIEKICDLTVTEEEYLKSGLTAVAMPSAGFADILKNLGISKKVKYENTENENNHDPFGGNENGKDENNDVENSGKRE